MIWESKSNRESKTSCRMSRWRFHAVRSLERRWLGWRCRFRSLSTQRRWLKAQEWARLSRECKEWEEPRDEFGTIVKAEQQCGQTGTSSGHGSQSCQELGWTLNSVSCPSVFQLDKAWKMSIGFDSQDVIGDLSKRCFRNSQNRSQIAVGKSLWKVREWRQRGLWIFQSWSKRRKDIRCHLEGGRNQARYF